MGNLTKMGHLIKMGDSTRHAVILYSVWLGVLEEGGGGGARGLAGNRAVIGL